MNCPKKVKVIYHFYKYDIEFVEDYHSVEIFFDRKRVLSLSDEYHDGSLRQIEGYLRACKQIWGEDFPKVDFVHKADIKD